MLPWWSALFLAVACAPGLAEAPGAAAVGVPYGFWGLNGALTGEGLSDVNQRFQANVVHTAHRDPQQVVEALLPMARTAGFRVTLRLTGDHPVYTAPDGSFDLDLWKASLARWAPAAHALGPYIADGTLAAHMILDDIHNFTGRDPTAADLDEMARISEVLLPGLPTFVREKATGLPLPRGGRYRHLDACVNQYKAMEGDAGAWAHREAARARELGLQVIQGLNIANGGDGSAGRPGWGPGKFPMSGEEIRRYGPALLGPGGVSMFLNWEYDREERWHDGSVGADWIDQPAQRAALAELGALLARTPVTPLLASPVPD